VADEELARRANIEALYRLLGRLAEKKRTVYVFHEIEGLSPAEIAQIVDAPVLTVRTRLFYARRELMGLLRDDPHLSAVIAELETESERSHVQGQLNPQPLDALAPQLAVNSGASHTNQVVSSQDEGTKTRSNH
jgi:RNA polymerase sigma-70 factor (ECF subfamily)